MQCFILFYSFIHKVAHTGNIQRVGELHQGNVVSQSEAAVVLVDHNAAHRASRVEESA